MNLDFKNNNEKPLDNVLEGSGFCNIFRTIGVIGDSLSSGEMEITTEDGIGGGIDMYEYSWGQNIARIVGCNVYNFSKGGMTAELFCESFGEECRAFGSDAIKCQCYIIALGVNDFNRSIADNKKPLPLGSVSDICMTSSFYNEKSIMGYYGKIIQKLKVIQPDAKIFCMTIPRSSDTDEISDEFTKELYCLSKTFTNTYMLDFRRYAPVYDEAFRKMFFMGSHMNAAGYVLTARMVISYIDYIIRHNFEEFKDTALIGTPYKKIRRMAYESD